MYLQNPRAKVVKSKRGEMILKLLKTKDKFVDMLMAILSSQVQP
jgi:hypothetical protein